MKRTFLTICVCILVLPVFAMSQGQQQNMEMTSWWDRPVVRNLGLSEDQLAQIRAIAQDSRDRLIQLRADVKIAQGTLADAMSQDPVDNNKASAAIDRVVAARGELLRAESQMSLKMRQVLTASQWQELRKHGAKRIMSGARRAQRTGRNAQQQ